MGASELRWKILSSNVEFFSRMATTNVGDKVIKPEAEFKIGGYEIMVDHVLQQDQYVRAHRTIYII